jgi:hypothetical protein
MDSQYLEPVVFAMAGAIAFKLIELLEWSEGNTKWTPKFTSPHFWLLYVVRPILGATLAVGYIASGNPLAPIVAMNVGMTAPLLLKAFLPRRTS